ncbi:hypothetical protein ACLF6K_18150 [Streptomyces xanthophaeus]|uniref:hypothetical protein n=1 Tax=Streptomyces xanthophaeus TaxID=67385 RepID=UPI0039902866
MSSSSRRAGDQQQGAEKGLLGVADHWHRRRVLGQFLGVRGGDVLVLRRML